MQQEPAGPTCGQPGCPADPVMRALPGPQMGRQNSPSLRKAGQKSGTRSLPRSARSKGLGPGKRAERSVSRGGSWGAWERHTGCWPSSGHLGSEGPCSRWAVGAGMESGLIAVVLGRQQERQRSEATTEVASLWTLSQVFSRRHCGSQLSHIQSFFQLTLSVFLNWELETDMG